jgi:hypothetical protein
VLTLLIFGTYLQLIKDSPSLPLITERTKAIYKVIKKIRLIYTEQYIKEILAIQNGLNTSKLYELLL